MMKNTVAKLNQSETKLLTQYMAEGGIGVTLSAQSNVGDNRRFNAMKTLIAKGILKLVSVDSQRCFGNRRLTGDYHQYTTVMVRAQLVKFPG